MRVLIMNRRDTLNPAGGGAEVYTLEVALGLLRRGHSVTIFSSRYKGAPARETHQGIEHIRAGNELTVHMHGFLHALFNRNRYDLFIDEYNGLGFMGFLLPRSMILIFQMYRQFWMQELGPVGYAPYLIEPLVLKLYRRMSAITISDSTVQDLDALGFKDIRVVMVALGNRPLEKPAIKETRPTLLYLARLRSTKRPADAIEIFKKVKQQVPTARLWMAGRGPEEARLRKMAEGMEDIDFLGFVSDEAKFDLMSRAHLLIVPGVREGFGINVVEAASMGTPAVGYNIHGLRDSIRHERTGLLASGIDDAAEKAVMLLKDTELYGRMARQCLSYAGEFNWLSRAEEFALEVENIASGMGIKIK